LVCAPLRSNVNLSRIARAASCCGVSRIICIGAGRLDRKIARDAAETIQIEIHRSMVPVLEDLRQQGFRLVGLEQTDKSQDLNQYQFVRHSALVIGNERLGLDDEVLARLDDIVEIPVWGLPYSHNVATAAAMALYEYCRQFPTG
jgi:tRNA G18 (ribose-2'-O)-methylase SpoU